MIYILPIITAMLLVLGQGLWKYGIKLSGEELTTGLLFSSKIFHFFFQKWILLGFFAYGLATIAYFVALSRYQYSLVQTIIISFSLIFSMVIASLLFSEKLSTV